MRTVDGLGVDGRTLNADECAPFLSPYLLHGFRRDVLTLKDARVTHDKVIGGFEIEDYSQASDGMFHLSVPIAFTGIGQLALIYCHVTNGFEVKCSEVYIHEFHLKCRRPIRSTSIEICLTQTLRRDLQVGAYYRGKIDINDGAFVGYGNFVFPLG